MKKMNPQVKKKWLNALRKSKIGRREITQAIGHLRHGTEDSFCCLGVLCELYRLDTGNGQWEQNSPEPDFKIGRSASYLVLPPFVMKWAGLTQNNPNWSDLPDSLANLNDKHIPFSKIAAVIEERL